MTAATTIRFDHLWVMPAAPERVFAALADVEQYPTWWPQVRRAIPVSSDRGHAQIRSTLPLSLWLTLRSETVDAQAGTLRVAISGDLEGWAQWQVSPADRANTSTRASYAQEVTISNPLWRKGMRIAPWVLRANHDRMMRDGRRGLIARLRPS